jgi:hypothetical protein
MKDRQILRVYIGSNALLPPIHPLCRPRAQRLEWCNPSFWVLERLWVGKQLVQLMDEYRHGAKEGLGRIKRGIRPSRAIEQSS